MRIWYKLFRAAGNGRCRSLFKAFLHSHGMPQPIFPKPSSQAAAQLEKLPPLKYDRKLRRRKLKTFRPAPIAR